MGRRVQDSYLSWSDFQPHLEVLSKCIFRNGYLALQPPKFIPQGLSTLGMQMEKQ